MAQVEARIADLRDLLSQYSGGELAAVIVVRGVFLCAPPKSSPNLEVAHGGQHRGLEIMPE
jgi:hypothetical protein